MTARQGAHPTPAALAEGFDPDLFLSDPDLIAPLTRDRTGAYAGEPVAVSRPRSTAALAALVRRCRALGIGVVPQGGLTGLVGAAVSGDVDREVVVLLDRMAAVRLVDATGFAMVVEAGCVLETAKRAAEEHDMVLPITFGSQGSCRIGGVVATNAGGFDVLRYGMTRDLVLEVVLPDGRVWDGLRTLRKDNRGYDLKQLFIGAEGTLGIVTAAAFKLFPEPTRVETALVGLRSIDDAMVLYGRARRSCSDLLSAFEFMTRDGLALALADRPDLADPLGEPCPAYVLMEAAASGPVDLSALVEDLFESAADLILDTARSPRAAPRRDRLWLLREAMVAAQSRSGPYHRTDASVPLHALPPFLDEALARLAAELPDGRPVAYGHVGDGNVHLNVVPPATGDLDRRRAVPGRRRAGGASSTDQGRIRSRETGHGRVKGGLQRWLVADHTSG